MTCMTCKHWKLKESPMARDGFALCAKLNSWEYVADRYKCEKHEPLPDDLAKARAAWFAKVDGKK